MSEKKFILHADDGSVYKIGHGDLQSFKVADDHPQLQTYRDLTEKNKAGGDDACAIVAVTAE